MEIAENLKVQNLGICTVPNPMRGVRFTLPDENVLLHADFNSIRRYLDSNRIPPEFEAAGPREKIFFNPGNLRCGLVTCGGLCPGLNDVIRAVVLSLHHHYGVKTICGFRFGYEGLSPAFGHQPVILSAESVANIHQSGGTILGSSRGVQNVAQMVDTLERMGIGILFTIGGDGTQKGALAISNEASRRNLKLSVIGIPKTIDNDVSYIQKTFGFETAVAESKRAIAAAHAEAVGARNGIGLVKLMGRDSGFIAAYSVLVAGEVNFCLVPEVPFTLSGLLTSLEHRLKQRGHAVIVVAEGAGQSILQPAGERDASGNVQYSDIGVFLRDEIKAAFQKKGTDVTLKYIDPSYTIRSLPANAHDSALCLLFGQSAVHAGMAGRTGMIVGFWNHRFTHVPIELAVSARKKIDSAGWIWSSVLASTGQPSLMT